MKCKAYLCILSLPCCLCKCLIDCVVAGVHLKREQQMSIVNIHLEEKCLTLNTGSSEIEMPT